MLQNQFLKPERLTFRRFSNKGWSLFAALGREVRIGMLTAATLAAAAPALEAKTGVHADDLGTPFDTLRLSEATATATRAALAPGMAARQVTVVDSADLTAPGVHSINDALKSVPAIDVRQRGAYGVQTDISLLGGTFDQLSLLIDGIPVNTPQTGHNAGEFPLTLLDVERIEIVEGAAGRVFGAQAFSGAVNIITRRTPERLSLSLGVGSYGTALASTRTAWQSGSFGTSLSAAFTRSDGAVRHSAFTSFKSFWQGSCDNASFRLSSSIGVSITDFEANTFYSAAYPKQWEATRRYSIAVKGETKGRIRFAPSVSWQRNTDHYQLTRYSSSGENFNRTDIYSLGFTAWGDWAWGRTCAGAGLSHERLLSANLGHDLDESSYVAIPRQDSLFYTKSDERTNISYFLEHNIGLGSVNISAGVMAQRNSALNGGFRFYPGIDLRYAPNAKHGLYASWNKSLRLPTFTDLWYKSATQSGNSDLKAEECHTWKVGYTFSHPVLRGDFSASFMRGTNMIDWVMYSADDIYHATNFRLNNMGFTAALSVDFAAWMDDRQPLRTLTIGYAYLHQDRLDDTNIYRSNYALEYLRHKFTVSLCHAIWSHLAATWNFRLQRREGAYQEYVSDAATGQLIPYGTHGLLDLKLEWTAAHYTIAVEGTNITNTDYYDLGNVAQAGFQCLATITLRL